MIFDRTSNDVFLAKRIIREKVHKSLDLTLEEIETLERGTITADTLNRIEKKQSEIKDKLYKMGYFNAPITNKLWSHEDVFIQIDFERLVDNNKALRDAFYVFSNSPKNAVALYHYEEINALEKILVDISKNIDFTIIKYRRCGTFNCGDGAK